MTQYAVVFGFGPSNAPLAILVDADSRESALLEAVFSMESKRPNSGIRHIDIYYIETDLVKGGRR